MFIEKIDLYEYFKLPRAGEQAGYLYSYRHEQLTELKVCKTRPAILVFPGGGYSFVSKREAEPVALRFFSEGYDTFVLEYDTAPVSHYPVQIQQAAMAMLYLRSNAAKLQIDGSHIAGMGFSAGGHLCGCISFLWNDPAIIKMFGEDVCDLVRLDAAIFAYPVISSDESIAHRQSFANFCGKNVNAEEYSLERKVRADAPPCFIWATTTDELVSVENSLQLYISLKKVKVPVELHIFEEGKHGLSICSGEVETFEPDPLRIHVSKWIDMVLEFLCKHGFLIKNNL